MIQIFVEVVVSDSILGHENILVHKTKNAFTLIGGIEHKSTNKKCKMPEVISPKKNIKTP